MQMLYTALMGTFCAGLIAGLTIGYFTGYFLHKGKNRG